MKHFFAFVSALIFVLSCTSTIEKTDIPVASVSISRSSAELVEGESLTLTANVSPSDATEKTISWSSSKPSVASVDQKGTVNALSVGTTVIKASAGGKNDSCTITVISKTIEVSSITLDKSSLSLKIGEEYQFNDTINPSNATEKNVSWSSASSSIATVKNGLVKGISAGETEITASCGGKKAVCKVKIMPVEVESISLSKTELELFVGDSETITATINPENATNKQVTWSSSDSRIATVNEGSITGVKEGNVVITAKAGSKAASCSVTVTKQYVPVQSIVLSKTTLSLVEHGTEVLTAKVIPENASEQDITWDSSDRTVATVINGKVTAVKEGSATITARVGQISASCSVQVFKQGDPHLNYLTFEIVEGGYLRVECLSRDDYEYSDDGGITWKSLTKKQIVDQWGYGGSRYHYYAVTPYFYKDDIVLFRGDRSSATDSEQNTSLQFEESTASFNVSGNVTSLIKKDGFANLQYSRFPHLFDNTNVVSAENLILPTPNADGCFQFMFSGCKKLTSAPPLNGTTLTNACYRKMFAGCVNLVSIPSVLPAQVMAENCYSGMFSGCSSLTYAPKLPSTRLSISCYESMFQGCSKLTSAPELPAMVMAKSCYESMFQNCSSLKNPPALPATTLAESCYSRMFQSCVLIERAPVLPSEELAQYCYYGMFFDCNKLVYVKALFIDPKNTPGCTTGWLDAIDNSGGTFVKSRKAKWSEKSEADIPEKWTLITED